MTLIESYYNFMKKPYYELEFFIDENRRIGTEYFPVNGQTIIKSKKYKELAFYIPKAYSPDIIGYKRRVKFYVENAFPRVDPGTYAPTEDYEILLEGTKDETGKMQFIVARSDFFRKINETKITSEIIAEPPGKWDWLNSPVVLLLAIAAVIAVTGMFLIPGLKGG